MKSVQPLVFIKKTILKSVNEEKPTYKNVNIVQSNIFNIVPYDVQYVFWWQLTFENGSNSSSRSSFAESSKLLQKRNSSHVLKYGMPQHVQSSSLLRA